MKKTNKHWQRIVNKARAEVQEHFVEIWHSLEFGAYFEPENYFVSYIFKTTEEMNKAKEKGLFEEINNYHKARLLHNGYPQEAIKDCDFASQEECEREYNGNWYYYYK